jgi:hypothetical protein
MSSSKPSKPGAQGNRPITVRIATVAPKAALKVVLTAALAALLSGCTATPDESVLAGPNLMFALTIVVFVIASTMMARAAAALVQATQLLAAVLIRLAAAVTAIATVVVVAGAGIWLVTLTTLR